MLKILVKYLKPYYISVICGMVVLFGQAIAELYLPDLMSDIVNKGMVQGDIGMIYKTGGLMLFATFVSMVCSIIASFVSAKIAMGLGRDLRSAVFRKVGAYSLHELEKIGTASLITRTTNDIVQVQQVVIMGFRFIIYSPIMCIGGMIMAIRKDTSLSIIFAVALPLLILIMVVLASFVIPKFTLMQKRIDKLNLITREGLTGIRVIRAFNKMNTEKKRFDDANRDLMDVSIKVNKIMAIMMPVMMLIFNVTAIAIIWFGGVRISRGQMDIGNMMAFMQYAMQIIMSVLMIAVMFVMIPRGQASSVRINEVLEMKAEVLNTEDPVTPVSKGKVEFRNVSFRYEGSEKPVLENVSFTSNTGETTAIIGGTGSGKSTIINLIPRFYDVSEGQVLVDDVAVKNLDKTELRSKIGFVPQGAILFSGTISENIRFGNKNATDEEVIHAAEVAQAADFIEKMPEKFDTQIAQGGTNVSGGQKQRLSIARALVRKPEIYIFDDSFSALDVKTDASLRAALKNETRESTVIIVAQRVTSIMDADRILVLDEGRIVGEGKHRELLASCEVYREICESQLSKEELG